MLLKFSWNGEYVCIGFEIIAGEEITCAQHVGQVIGDFVGTGNINFEAIVAVAYEIRLVSCQLLPRKVMPECPTAEWGLHQLCPAGTRHWSSDRRHVPPPTINTAYPVINGIIVEQKQTGVVVDSTGVSIMIYTIIRIVITLHVGEGAANLDHSEFGIGIQISAQRVYSLIDCHSKTAYSKL